MPRELGSDAAAGVVIHEATEAVEVAPGRVACRSGVVRCDSGLLATESHTTQLPGQGRRYLPLYSLMVATEPLDAAAWDELGWPHGLTVLHRRHLCFYAQRTSDDRIAISGRGAPYRLRRPISDENERSACVRQRPDRHVAVALPRSGGAPITEVARSPSGGLVHAINYDRAGRWGPPGTTAATASSPRTSPAGRSPTCPRPALTTMPWSEHHARLWEPEPIRYLASAGIVRVLATADRHEDRTGRHARRASLVAPFTGNH